MFRDMGSSDANNHRVPSGQRVDVGLLISEKNLPIFSMEVTQMSKLKAYEFLRLCLASGRFTLTPEWEILFANTRHAQPMPLDWSLNRIHGQVAFVRLYDSKRRVRRADLTYALHHGRVIEEPLYCLDGDLKNMNPGNLVTLKRFLQGWPQPKPASDWMRKMDEFGWKRLAHIRDRYWPSSVPLEVLDFYGAGMHPTYLRAELKKIPVEAIAPEQRLQYEPDHRAKKYRWRSTDPVKAFPEDFPQRLRPKD